MQSEENNRLYIYYFITAAIFVILKLYHSNAETQDLLFLIKPVSKFIETGTGALSVYIANKGYYFADLNIIIDKSCSGFNFACLTFLLLNFLAFKYIHSTRLRILVFPVTLICSYCATFLVSSSRIMLAVFLNGHINSRLSSSPEWMHLAQGIFVYLFFLILIYISADYLLSKIKQRYEKLA